MRIGVNMVWYKAIAPDCHITLLAPLSHEVNIHLVIIITEEGWLSSITTLSNMVWIPWGNGSRNPCHKVKLFLYTIIVNN